MNEELRQFIKESLERGQDRDAIRNVLVEAGWQEREVNSNLASFADVDFSGGGAPAPALPARAGSLSIPGILYCPVCFCL